MQQRILLLLINIIEYIIQTYFIVDFLLFLCRLADYIYYNRRLKSKQNNGILDNIVAIHELQDKKTSEIYKANPFHDFHLSQL